MSLLVICGITGLFANTLAADDKHFLRDSEILQQPIQMQLSKPQKTFSMFCSISEIYLKF